MGPEEANDSRGSRSPRMAPAQQLFLNVHHHIIDFRLIADEAQSRAVEGERSESATCDAKVSAISAHNTINDFTAD